MSRKDAQKEPLLVVDDLHVDFHTRSKRISAVKGPSFSVHKGEALGLVGESGCGKSVTTSAILGMIELPGEITGGDIRWKGKSLLGADAADYRRQVCGNEISIVFQDPMTSFDPLFTIGYQICEVLHRHTPLRGQKARARAVELLDLVRITRPDQRVDQYPHELSGGMRQRALIAMSLASEPELLIADEPTTALDVTVQAAILELLKDLQEKLDIGVLFITHDLGVVARFCHNVAVMYQGEIVEKGTSSQILQSPKHPYSAGLLACQPSLKEVNHRLLTIADSVKLANQTAKGAPATKKVPAEAKPAYAPETNIEPVLQVNNLCVDFDLPKQSFFSKGETLHAVKNVSFDIKPGETLGLVGESGSGKTTTGRAVLQSNPIKTGQVYFKGENITGISGEKLRLLRRDMQLIFQDPYSSLNPRMSVLDIVSEPLVVHQIETDRKILRERVTELMETVGMPKDCVERHPHSFSGGQRQRIGIARALTLEPSFIVADEPVSALDVSVRAQVVNLMQDLQEKLGIAFLFIAHDLAVVRHIAHRVAIMKQGEIVEIGTRDEIYNNPQQDYTKQLLSAVPEVHDIDHYRVPMVG